MAEIAKDIEAWGRLQVQPRYRIVMNSDTLKRNFSLLAAEISSLLGLSFAQFEAACVPGESPRLGLLIVGLA
jgi:hypothetical protein